WEVSVLGLNYGPTYSDTAQLIKSDLEQVGITLNLKLYNDLSPVIGYGNRDATHEIAVGPTTVVNSTNADLLGIHHSTRGRNASKVKDPKLDQMIEQQAALVKDPDARKKALLEIQRYILNSAHQLAILGTVPPSLRWKQVQDYFLESSNLEETWMYVWL